MFLRHIEDLQRRAFFTDCVVFSEFLSFREVAILTQTIADLPEGRFFLFGGLKEAERKVICFHPPYLTSDEIIFPISTLKISILGAKFQKKLPKHGDFLGAILGLGIERKLIGDIIISEEENSAYFFCMESIEDFILSELISVGRCKVTVSKSFPSEISAHSRIEIKSKTVASLRIDAVVSEVFHLSRSKVKELLLSELIIVNGVLPSSPHFHLKEGDIVSCRGEGKFILNEILGYTKKDKIKFSFGIYK